MARAKRWDLLNATYPNLAEMTVLDLGGRPEAWRVAPVKPARLIVWNVFSQAASEPWIETAVEDCCGATPPDVDLIYSNSVIEHVGGHWRRERLAETIRSAPRYWVQTPNRYFPLEPHFLFPWLQHLPLRLRQAIVTRWPLGHGVDVADREALARALSIELLSLTELRFYFPEAEIYREKVCGLTKSFIAFRR
jgi:hypothetical protein